MDGRWRAGRSGPRVEAAQRGYNAWSGMSPLKGPIQGAILDPLARRLLHGAERARRSSLTATRMNLRSEQWRQEMSPPRGHERSHGATRQNEIEVRLAIAGASAAVAMHPQTLRKYERAGLLRPARRSGGSRHYSANDMARLALIKHLADVRRINVAGMALVLAIHDDLVALLEAVDPMEAEAAKAYVRERVEATLEMIAEGGPETGE